MNFSIDNLSICIPSYNNLRHLKNCYHSIRKHYPDLELVMMDDGSDDGTLDWMGRIGQEDDNVILQRFEERHGHTVLYDAGVELASNDIIGIMHCDMLVTINTFENMLKHLERGKVVCATRIEPPLHPSGREKIVKDFGMDFDSLDVPAFEQFAKRQEKEYKGETTNGMFAPWMIHKEDYKEVGGHDHIFAPFPYEDSDIFQRWMLEGYELVQSWDSFVYHLTCRGHKWNEEVGTPDDGYEQYEERARRNFIRKWGTMVKNDEYQHPIILPKYDVGFVIHNCTKDVFYAVEPWCSDIYVNGDVMEYEDNAREIDVRLVNEKTYFLKQNEPTNDIVVEFDGSKLFNDEHPHKYMYFIQEIQHIIEDNPIGKFRYEIFDINIKKKKPFEKNHFRPIYKKEL